MRNPAELFTKNKFVDWCLKIVPENPVLQSQYMYYLSTIVFIGLIGFAISTWIAVFNQFAWTTLFQGLFMTAIGLLSLAGVKQMRGAYHMTKKMYSNIKAPESVPKGPEEALPPLPALEVESKDEMLAAFEEKEEKK